MPRTYSLPEAAAMLGVRPDTMSTQARRGKLRARKVGRDWRVSESEIARYRSESLGRYLPRKSEMSETPGSPRPAPKPRKSETHRSTAR